MIMRNMKMNRKRSDNNFMAMLNEYDYFDTTSEEEMSGEDSDWHDEDGDSGSGYSMGGFSAGGGSMDSD